MRHDGALERRSGEAGCKRRERQQERKGERPVARQNGADRDRRKQAAAIGNVVSRARPREGDTGK
jgi:hypothetical protein